MECNDLLDIFKRSEDCRNDAKFTSFVGDGDAKNFSTLSNANIYDKDIKKLECVAHVAKQFGAALIKLRNQLSIGGAGGLTMNLIKQLQGYFGAAIKKNKNNLAKMKDAIFAIYYHKLNDHKFCSKDKTTWCKHIRMIKYKSNDKQAKNLIKREIMEKTKQVFVKFTNHSLLIRCLKELTQNVCESFNSLIWIRVPKSTYRSIDSIKLGVYDAVICSNESYSHRLKVFD